MPHIEHPYTNLTGGSWLRGNLHAHTTRSDGSHSPQALIDAYAALRYQFLAISDHDLIATAADHARWDSRGMILVPANEITADGPHMLHINGSRTVGPNWCRQHSIDEANAPGSSSGDTEGGSFVIVNHPNWWQNCDHCPTALLLQWRDYLGLEIFNGATNMTLGNGYATDKWDQVLPVVVARGQMVWGFAHDDTHHPRDVGQGWLMAYVTTPGLAGVMEALRRGRFYPSTGVTIESIEVEGLRIRMVTRDAHRIVAVTAYGRRLAVVDERSVEFDFPVDSGGGRAVPYVRFDCWGAGEKFAWTQPFVIRP